MDAVGYRHTQRGRTVPIVCAIGAAVVLLVLALVPGQPSRGAWVVAGLTTAAMLVSAWAFSSLTVEVTERELRWRFGPGVVAKNLPLAGIASVTPVRTSLWHGIGIHWIGTGWLYNVALGDAVEVRTVGGKRIRIGTDEPVALTNAIERAARR